MITLDGWVKLLHRHPRFRGLSFEAKQQEAGHKLGTNSRPLAPRPLFRCIPKVNVLC